MKILKIKGNSVTVLLITFLFCFHLYSCGGGGGSTSTPPSVISVSVSPSLAFVPAGKNQLFSASISGSSNQNVTWSITEAGGGTINSLGSYTAPNIPQTYHVTATSVADSTKSATVAVTVPEFPRFAYVANKNDGTVSVYSINSATGLLRPNGYTFIGGAAKPESIAIDPSGLYLYVADNGNNRIWEYSIKFSNSINTTGTLSPIGSVSAGTGSDSLIIDPSGKYVYVTNYTDGTVSAYSITNTGALSPVSGSPFNAGTNPVSIIVDPSGQFVYVANAGSNDVWEYTIAPGTGALTNTGTMRSRSGSFAIAMSKGNAAVTYIPKFAYTANYGSADVSIYKIDSVLGTLSSVSCSTILNCGAGTNPLAITADPSGQYVYVANSGDNTVSAYRIDPITGVLTSTSAAITTNLLPNSIAVDPSGRFVYVANYSSNNIGLYAIGSDGSLSEQTSSGSPFTVGTYPQTLSIDPTGQYLYAGYNPTTGNSDVEAYLLDPVTGALSLPITGSPFGSGTLPSSMIVEPSGNFAYVTDLLSNNNNLVEFSISNTFSNSGSLIFATTMALGGTPVSITVDPAGRFAFVTISQSDYISTYGIDSKTGALIGKSGDTFLSNGSVPFGIVIDISGRFAYVANSGSDYITSYTLDQFGVLGTATSVNLAGTNPRAVVTTGTTQ
jgi:6-phosphogluconolactonase